VFERKHNTVRTGKNMSNTFAIQNGVKQGDALSPLLFRFALEGGGSQREPGRTDIEWETSAYGLC
jgi:hypothetical protein